MNVGKLVSSMLIVANFALQADAYCSPDKSTGKSIETIVDIVLANNPELKFYENEIRAAKYEVQSSGLLDNPELETSIGRKDDAAKEGTAWSVSVIQTFEFPGRLSLRKAIANRQVKLAELGLRRFRRELAAKARVNAYELRSAQQIARAAREASTRGHELLSVLVQREPAGIAPLLETRIIEASVISLQQKAIDAEKDVQEKLFDLNLLTASPMANTLIVRPSELNLQRTPKVEELISSALESNFEIRIKVEELKAQGFRVELAKNERLPSFKIGPFFSKERASENESVAGLGFSVPLPIWNRNSAAIAAATAREEQAKTSLALTQRDVERELRENAIIFEQSIKQIQAWRPNLVNELREAAELADRHYRLGAIPVSTYVELQTQYVEGLGAILSIQGDALRSLQRLENLTNRELS